MPRRGPRRNPPPGGLGTSLTASSSVSLRQGMVVAYDPGTGRCAIRLGGTVIQDVPVLATLGALTLEVDDVVAVLQSSSTFFILGPVKSARDIVRRLSRMRLFTDDPAQTAPARIIATATHPGERGALELHSPRFGSGVIALGLLSPDASDSDEGMLQLFAGRPSLVDLTRATRVVVDEVRAGDAATGVYERPSDDDWQTPTLTTGWTSGIGAYAGVRYRRTAIGTLQLTGLAHNGSGSTLPAPAVVFTLPPRWRPPDRYASLVALGDGAAPVEVLPGGDVRVRVPVPDATGCAFDCTVPLR